MLLSIAKPCLLQLILLTLLFTQLNKVKPTNPSSTSHTLTNFTFPNFWSDIPKITFQGGASHSIGALQLTRIGNDCKSMRSDKGQASYSQPVFLWDSIGHEASFYTSFSFIVKNYDVPRVSADGFAFFLAPVNSTVKGYGGCLGLFRFSTAADPSKNQVVAVEFDTWPNYEWSDLSYPHIGIDVNSAVSVATTRWEDSDAYGSKMGTAHISYNATSKILKVRLTYDNGNVYVLSHVVDLKKILPKWVRIGFSAGTGYRQTQFILSWSFTSTIGITETSVMNQNLSFAS